MFLIAPKVFLLLVMLCINISQANAALSEMDLKDKLTAKLTIKDVEVDTDGYQLKIEVTIKNLTQQTLQYQRKSIDTMLNLFVYDHKGLGLNMDELKVVAKSRNSHSIPIEFQPKAHHMFNLSYKLKRYSDKNIEHNIVYIQAHIVFTKYSKTSLQYGSIRSEKIKIIYAELDKFGGKF